MHGSVGTLCSHTLVGGSSNTLTASCGRPMTDTMASALSLGQPFMPMQAEWVQTGDMPILSAIPSQVMPACFLADRIIIVTSSLVIMLGISNASFMGNCPFVQRAVRSEAEIAQAGVILGARALRPAEFSVGLVNRHIVD